MQKNIKIKDEETTETEAFEVIETAIEDIETLARAFNLISEVCREANEELVSFEGCSNEFILN